MSHSILDKRNQVPTSLLSAWLDITNVRPQHADVFVGTVSVPRRVVSHVYGGGPTLADLAVTKRLPPTSPPTILFMDPASMPLVPRNPGEPGLYLHHAPPNRGGIVSGAVHLMAKDPDSSNYVYMGIYNLRVDEEDVGIVTAAEWPQIPEKMTTRMVRRITYGRPDSMKGIRARSYLRRTRGYASETAEEILVRQDVTRNQSFRLYGYRYCENAIRRSFVYGDENLYVYGLEYAGYSHVFAANLGPSAPSSPSTVSRPGSPTVGSI